MLFRRRMSLLLLFVLLLLLLLFKRRRMSFLLFCQSELFFGHWKPFITKPSPCTSAGPNPGLTIVSKNSTTASASSINASSVWGGARAVCGDSRCGARRKYKQGLKRQVKRTGSQLKEYICLQFKCFGKVTQIKHWSPCCTKINTEVYNYYVVVFLQWVIIYHIF